MRALARLDASNRYHVFCEDRRAADAFAVRAPNVDFHPGAGVTKWLSFPVTQPLAMRRERLDFLHALFLPPPVAPCPFLFTSHGSEMFARPELYPAALRWRMNAMIRLALARARQVICVSEHTRRFMVERFALPASRAHAVPNGASACFRPMGADERAPVLSRLGVRPPYLLFAGRLEPRKNPVRLLEAYAGLRATLGEGTPALVLAGEKTWSGREVDATISARGLRPFVVETGHVSRQDLAALYSGAEAFVFPSLWEGFGIPPLEAMACGTPVVASAAPSIPEVTGGAALLVDPLSPAAIADALRRVLTDAALASTLREAGRARAAQFGWERTARETLAVYALMPGTPR